MTNDDIISAVIEIVQDGAYQDTEISAILDNVVLAIGATVRIPSAKKIGTLTVSASGTSTNVKTAYSNFSPKFVNKIYNSTTEKFIAVYDSLEGLFAHYPDFNEEGNVEAAAFEDYMLWTQKVPISDEVLSFVYYELPSVPSESSDTSVVWLPAGLHYNLLVCGVAAVAFGELEDGLESATGEGKPNTGHYAANYFRGIKDYRNYLAKHTPHQLSSFWSE